MTTSRDATDGAGGLGSLGLVDQQLSSLAQHGSLADTRCADLAGDDVGGSRDVLGGQLLRGLGAVLDAELVRQLHETELTGLDLVGNQTSDRSKSQTVVSEGLLEKLSQRFDLGALVTSHPDDQAVRVQDDGGQVVTVVSPNSLCDPLGDDDSGDRRFSVLGDVLG